jgi:hypothetical protein
MESYLRENRDWAVKRRRRRYRRPDARSPCARAAAACCLHLEVRWTPRPRRSGGRCRTRELPRRVDVARGVRGRLRARGRTCCGRTRTGSRRVARGHRDRDRHGGAVQTGQNGAEGDEPARELIVRENDHVPIPVLELLHARHRACKLRHELLWQCFDARGLGCE